MRAKQEGSSVVVSLRIRNSRVISLAFYLEPWGEEYLIPPDATFEVIARGPQGDCLEVEYADDHITVYGWSGSVVSLFHKGVELGPGNGPPTPVPSVTRVTKPERH